jgi:hypothetical protein
MLPYKYHRYLFLLGIALLVTGMLFSFALLSIAQITLASNWLLEGDFKRKAHELKQRRAILLILSIYLVHLLGLINTGHFFGTLGELPLIIAKAGFHEILPALKTAALPQNFVFALHDLRIKLPLLALPLVFGTSRPLQKKEFKFILHLFVTSVLVSTFISGFVLFGFSGKPPTDARYASLFISHIRFSLIIVLSIFSLLYLIFSNKFELYKREKIVSLIIIAWLICFLILLKSITGIVIFLLLLPVGAIWCASFQKNRMAVKTAKFASIFFLFGAIAYFIFSFFRYTQKYNAEISPKDLKTPNGNPYMHKPESEEYENGHKVWIYVCEKELSKEWNRHSEFRYDSSDRKGQAVRTTLIRYLTSLGYTKDSLGISQLDEEDIVMIESGYTNYLYKNKFALYPRLYEMFWEIEKYVKGADPSGYSLAQRIEYMKTGIQILKHNFWFGTGTGDIEQAFQQQYASSGSKLKPEYRYRTHNQFFTFLLTFGIFGFLWILFALFAAPALEKKYSNFLFLTFFLIGVLSMFNEDTLETHVGVSFFAFFYSFILFSMPENGSSQEKT